MAGDIFVVVRLFDSQLESGHGSDSLGVFYFFGGRGDPFGDGCAIAIQPCELQQIMKLT